jgi:hypothetical protein
MKTSLGDDRVAINLDYEAVKEVVQIYLADIAIMSAPD